MATDRKGPAPASRDGGLALRAQNGTPASGPIKLRHQTLIATLLVGALPGCCFSWYCAPDSEIVDTLSQRQLRD
jgi:hypothetical protein